MPVFLTSQWPTSSCSHDYKANYYITSTSMQYLYNRCLYCAGNDSHVLNMLHSKATVVTKVHVKSICLGVQL